MHYTIRIYPTKILVKTLSTGKILQKGISLAYMPFMTMLSCQDHSWGHKTSIVPWWLKEETHSIQGEALSYYHNNNFLAQSLHSRILVWWRKRPSLLSPCYYHTANFVRAQHSSILMAFTLCFIILAVRERSKLVLQKIFVFQPRSEQEISELSRCIFSITVISESWWILTSLPQWITMEWQKFYTTASPHRHHDRQIPPVISAYSTFIPPTTLFTNYSIFWDSSSYEIITPGARAGKRNMFAKRFLKICISDNMTS